jgi:hypothetical protein
MAWLLDRYSSAYASNQYRALQQFFKWLAAEDQLPDPVAGLQPPRVSHKLVPVFTSQELTRLEQACAGRSFAQRRDTAIIAVFTATGIRLSELAGLRCSDVDLWRRRGSPSLPAADSRPGRPLLPGGPGDHDVAGAAAGRASSARSPLTFAGRGCANEGRNPGIRA